MSRGDDNRVSTRGENRTEPRAKGGGENGEARTSRSSIRMTAERARAIQAHADRTGTNQDFKARAMSAGDRDEDEQE